MSNITATEVEKRIEEHSQNYPDYFKEVDLDRLIKIMEEIAQAPAEEMGKRVPGERGAYERFNQERATQVPPWE